MRYDKLENLSFLRLSLSRGESLSHFLGRFQRENYLKPAQLGKLTGLGATISRWEKLYLNPFPQPQELEALAAIVQVEVDRLMLMLPHQGMTLQPRPILLCGACYPRKPLSSNYLAVEK